jgi:hypothetical protein
MKVTSISNRGHDMKVTHLFIAGALLPLSAAFAQSPAREPTQSPPQSPQGQGATFESLDANADGRISKAEAAANANVSAQFSSYDLNGDGFIERAEVNRANDPQATTPKQ